MAKTKQILNILLYVLLGVVFVICALVTVSSINRKDGVSNVFGYTTMTVQTDSMQGTINKGDLIVGKLIGEKDYDKLEVGDIITFYIVIDGERIIDTHRIHEIKEIMGETFYQTKGDNVDAIDDGYRNNSDIIAIYKMRIPGLGSVIDFLKSTLGFFLCIFTPLMIFIIYEVYRLISIIIYNKKVQMIDDVKDSTSDDVKNAIIQEYLEKQKLEQAKKDESENKVE